MTRWARGQAEIDLLLGGRELQRITGAAANGEPLLEKAARTLSTAAMNYAVEKAMRAQFGEGFRDFGILRRRRNELDYPTIPGETTTREEADEAVKTVQQLVAAAEKLLPTLGLY